MKIPVHEIEGDYYCKIDDIAVTKTAINKKIILPKDVAIFCFDNFYLFIKITEMVDAVAGRHIRDKGKECFEANPDNVWDRQLFYSYDKSYTLIALYNGLYRINTINKSNDILEAITICKPDKPPIPKPTIMDLYSYQKASEIDDFLRLSKKSGYCNVKKENELYSETTTIKLKPTDSLYIRLSDAKIYLADCGIINGDFRLVLPQNKVKKNQSETHVKEPNNALPYLDKNNEKYAPLLAVAVDIWERLFIHGEGNQNQGLEPRAIDLIEKHYPNLTTGKEKNSVAYIAITHLGKTKKSQKNKNNG